MRQLSRVLPLIVFLYLTGPVALLPQQGTLGGFVTDSASGLPLEGAQVILGGTGTTMLTRSDGIFRFQLRSGWYMLLVRRIGYRSFARWVVVHLGETTDVSVILARVPTPQPGDTSWLEWSRPIMRSVPAALGLSPLDWTSDSLPRIRIWVNPNPNCCTGYMLDLAVRGSDTVGVLARWLPRRALESRALGRFLRDGCGPEQVRGAYIVCELPERRPWGDVYAEFASYGIWTLQDESYLPGFPDSVPGITDGDGLTVELKDGEQYRTYSFGVAFAGPWPEARQAFEILRTVICLASARLDPTVRCH